MNRERGSALILTLIMLALLMALGGALLSSVELEVAIGDNYRSETQLLYLAETGFEEARGILRTSAKTPSQLLAVAAGTDGILSNSRDLDTLLNSDDVPILSGGNRTSGKLLFDTTGQPVGRYYVFLRNDSADGMTNLSDSNQVLTLLSIGVLGNSRKVLEVTVMKWRFPPLPASLVMDGASAAFAVNSGSEVNGLDASAHNGDRYSIGVSSGADAASILEAIPAQFQFHFSGLGAISPPPADVFVINSRLDPRLRTPVTTERIVRTVIESESDVWNPGWSGLTSLGNVGSPSDYRIGVVNGDCELKSGSGFGVLLVRGNLVLNGNYSWDGLILVIGQGMVRWSGSGSVRISGGMFLARTRANDRGPSNELGSVLANMGQVGMDISPPGTILEIVNPGNTAIEKAQQKLPYLPIAYREY